MHAYKISDTLRPTVSEGSLIRLCKLCSLTVRDREMPSELAKIFDP